MDLSNGFHSRTQDVSIKSTFQKPLQPSLKLVSLILQQFYTQKEPSFFREMLVLVKALS